MYCNGVNCDIYIGTSAGKKLLNDIRNAKKSIKIISPYLSPSLISELINFRNRNLEVELVTSDDIEDYNQDYKKNIHKLIIQNKVTDQEAVKRRETWNDIKHILMYINFGLIALLLGLIYFIKDMKIAFGIIPIVIIFFVIKLYNKKIQNIKIYSYWYSQFFPFKVYISPYKSELSNTFIHGKIYLIDDQIAYLGSLNFTESGTKKNYETRIRTTDPKCINEIIDEFYQLLNHSNLPERNIQYWGKQLYDEPIN